MRVSAVVPAVAVACLVASAARAQDKQTCNAAYQEAQVARAGHKYVKAREQLRVCASGSCPGFITKDCTDWLKDIEPRVPSVVFAAKNAAGSDVVDVKVTIDGSPLVDKLDGIAVDVDPGAHTFGFEGPDGKAEQKVVVTEGTKAQRVAVTFGPPGAAAIVATSVPSAVVATSPSAAPAAPAASSGGSKGFGAEPVDSGFSFGFRIGYALPLGDVNSVNGNGNSLSTGVNGQVPFWFDAGYLLDPHFYVGAYLSYGVGFPASTAFTGECSATGVSCSASDFRIGVDVQVRFLGKSRAQPWFGLGFLGYESAGLSISSVLGSESTTFTGIEWVTPQLGFDYKVLPTLSAGLFVGISLSEYLGASASVNNGPSAGSLTGDKALHEWFFMGARTSWDLHLF
jgi:hypothetical protein